MAGSPHVKSLNETNFSSTAAQGVALVDFWAPWCGPCMMQAPILDAVADAVQGRATVAKVNVDEAPSLAGRFAVQAIPTLVLLKEGREVGRFVGMQSKASLLQAIDRAAAAPAAP